MLIVQSKLNPSIMFVDGITYVGPFVLLTNEHNKLLVIYGGWYLEFTIRLNGIWELWIAYRPAHVVICGNQYISGDGIISYSASLNFNCRLASVEFNINFICCGLRRDVFVEGRRSHKLMALPVENWLNTYKN